MKCLPCVNGWLVSRGPVDLGWHYAGGSTETWFDAARDWTPYFVEGANVITAAVFRRRPVGFTV